MLLCGVGFEEEAVLTADGSLRLRNEPGVATLYYNAIHDRLDPIRSSFVSLICYDVFVARRPCRIVE